MTRRLAALGLCALTAAANAADPTPAPAPAALPSGVGTSAVDYANRPVAYIYGNIPVTRADLGEFLISRGGAEKLELLVNKKIIDAEAAKRNVSVTDVELEAALAEDLEGLSLKKEDFVRVVLPKYGKTLYEWMEDVVRPRILLTKMARDRVKTDEADLKIQFEREYGEKRRVQIILFPQSDDLKSILKTYETIRNNPVEFDRAARQQANPALSASAGHIKPVARHLSANEKIVEERAFQLNAGEVSEVLKTQQGYLVMKLHEIIPPADGKTFEQVKPRLEKQAFDEKMSGEIPKFFAELKQGAAPNFIFEGPGKWAAPAAAKAPAATDGAVVPAGK